jgi:hypothetical protein
MGRNQHRTIPLEIRWRVPDRLPLDDEQAELAYIRFLDETTRVTVARLMVPVSSPHASLYGVTTLARAEGWEVRINGERQHAEPLSFLDACYAAYATFVEAVPELAKVMTRTLAVKARHEGWNPDEMDVHIVEEANVDPDHTAAPADA